MALIIRSIVRDKKAGISSCGAKCGGCGACHGWKMPRLIRLRRQRPQGC
ncbi:MAG: FeoB-associated Cys-rich membrane protein [Oscillospiraceae bacterium]